MGLRDTSEDFIGVCLYVHVREEGDSVLLMCIQSILMSELLDRLCVYHIHFPLLIPLPKQLTTYRAAEAILLANKSKGAK